jgi:hypothetical protein
VRYGVAVNRSMTKERIRSRSGAWWVADEEPEILSAGRGNKPALSRVARQRLAVLIGMALAAGMGSLFLL